MITGHARFASRTGPGKIVGAGKKSSHCYANHPGVAICAAALAGEPPAWSHVKSRSITDTAAPAALSQGRSRPPEPQVVPRTRGPASPNGVASCTPME
ncbi:hypothetical protein Kisp01_63190 [Kineosporia sp. NBRC 101677]|nr:hypothetical protein Kisp01_63190 [Kineosporia sp. NBRC 101677]